MQTSGGAMCGGDWSGCTDLMNRPHWYVVTTKRQREEFAAERLARRGIENYLPMVVESLDPSVAPEAQPMFPGYLLVRAVLSADYYSVVWSPGVRHFVSFGSGPEPLEDDAVAFLRGREGSDGLIRLRAGAPCGAKVLISDGPFQGFTAIVERSLPARDRVLVLLQLLQRQTRVELPRGVIQHAYPQS
jgi:transcriptional antiterminator NusG